MKTIISGTQTKINKNGKAGKGNIFSFIFNILSQAYYYYTIIKYFQSLII